MAGSRVLSAMYTWHWSVEGVASCEKAIEVRLVRRGEGVSLHRLCIGVTSKGLAPSHEQAGTGNVWKCVVVWNIFNFSIQWG